MKIYSGGDGYDLEKKGFPISKLIIRLKSGRSISYHKISNEINSTQKNYGNG